MIQITFNIKKEKLLEFIETFNGRKLTINIDDNKNNRNYLKITVISKGICKNGCNLIEQLKKECHLYSLLKNSEREITQKNRELLAGIYQHLEEHKSITTKQLETLSEIKSKFKKFNLPKKFQENKQELETFILNFKHNRNG